MSRQSKKRKQAVAQKGSKGASKGPHREEGLKFSRFPGHQPAPSWVRPTGAKGWFNAPKSKDNPKSAAKPKAPKVKGQIPHF